MDKIIKTGCFLMMLCVIAYFIVNIIDTIYIDYDKLGDGYKYNPYRRDITGSVDIPWKVVEYAYDDNYIVATQKLREGLYMDGYKLGGYDSVSICHSDKDGDGVVYWIVNKKTGLNILCGDRQEFIKKCDSLELSDIIVANITY